MVRHSTSLLSSQRSSEASYCLIPNGAMNEISLHSQTDKRGFKTKREAELFLASGEGPQARESRTSARNRGLTR